MKRYHFFLLLIICITGTLLQPSVLTAQSKKDSARIAAIKEMVEGQNYTFKAQSVTPMSGRLRQLTSDYDLQVSKDVIVSQLPYFGRAYSAPISPSDGGIQFTSKEFDYSAANKKKGGWDITIKYKDTRDAKQMQLSIFDNGTASLQVISNNRQPISFNGYITAPANKK